MDTDERLGSLERRLEVLVAALELLNQASDLMDRQRPYYRPKRSGKEAMLEALKANRCV